MDDALTPTGVNVKPDVRQSITTVDREVVVTCLLVAWLQGRHRNQFRPVLKTSVSDILEVCIDVGRYKIHFQYLLKMFNRFVKHRGQRYNFPIALYSISLSIRFILV